MSPNATGVRRRRSLSFVVRSVEHQLRFVLPQPCPTTIIGVLRTADDLESQQVAIEPQRCRHVEDLDQRTEPTYIDCHQCLLPVGCPTLVASATGWACEADRTPLLDENGPASVRRTSHNTRVQPRPTRTRSLHRFHKPRATRRRSPPPLHRPS